MNRIETELLLFSFYIFFSFCAILSDQQNIHLPGVVNQLSTTSPYPLFYVAKTYSTVHTLETEYIYSEFILNQWPKNTKDRWSLHCVVISNRKKGIVVFRFDPRRLE